MKPPLEVVTNLLRIYPESISIKNYGKSLKRFIIEYAFIKVELCLIYYFDNYSFHR